MTTRAGGPPRKTRSCPPLQVRQFGEPASDLGRIQGDVENGVLPAGQSIGLIHEVKSAGEIVRDVVAEAEAALKRIAL